jgi:hypothetical protein
MEERLKKMLHSCETLLKEMHDMAEICKEIKNTYTGENIDYNLLVNAGTEIYKIGMNSKIEFENFEKLQKLTIPERYAVLNLCLLSSENHK